MVIVGARTLSTAPILAHSTKSLEKSLAGLVDLLICSLGQPKAASSFLTALHTSRWQSLPERLQVRSCACALSLRVMADQCVQMEWVDSGSVAEQCAAIQRGQAQRACAAVRRLPERSREVRRTRRRRGMSCSRWKFVIGSALAWKCSRVCSCAGRKGLVASGCSGGNGACMFAAVVAFRLFSRPPAADFSRLVCCRCLCHPWVQRCLSLKKTAHALLRELCVEGEQNPPRDAC